MARVWNEKYSALYNRTYQVLYDAGVNEKLADELAAERTLAAALISAGACLHASRLYAAQSLARTQLFVKEPLYEQSARVESETCGQNAPQTGHADDRKANS